MARKRQPKREVPQQVYWTCLCGKRAWPTRAEARRRRRGVVNDKPGRRLWVYRCDEDPQAWHLGHVPWIAKQQGRDGMRRAG